MSVRSSDRLISLQGNFLDIKRRMPEWIQNGEKHNGECYRTAKLQKGECYKTTEITKQRMLQNGEK